MPLRGTRRLLPARTSCEPNLDRQTFAPIVLFTRQQACIRIVIRVPLRVEHTCHGVPLRIADTDVNARIGEDVLNPMRFVAVLGQDVEASVSFHEPDFNFSGQAGSPACGRKVQELVICAHKFIAFDAV